MINLKFLLFLKHKISILFGLLLFSTFIYYRFIRERLPKDIPLNLNILGFLIIVYLCCIYIYIIYKLLFPYKEPNKFIEKIIEYVYKPLKDFDTYLKDLLFIKSYYEDYISKFANNIKYLFKEKIQGIILFEWIFYIIPRIVLISTLLIDIYYFGRLYYIYKVLLIGILLILRRYILYSIKKAKIDFIEVLTIDISILMVYVPGVHLTERPEYISQEEVDEEDDDDWPPSMNLDLKTFIEFWTNFIAYNNYIDFYPHKYNNEEFTFHFVDLSEFYRYKIYKENPPYSLFFSNTFCARTQILKKSSKDFNTYISMYKKKTNDIIQLALMLEYKNINDDNSLYKYIKVGIFSCYLLSWLSILILSIHTLNIEDIINLIITIKPFDIF